jgi:hypothetical protein
MIVKLGQDPGFEDWASKDKAVKAAKMKTDFLVETTLGFLPGKRGDYIVEIAPQVRFPCSETAFLASYKPLQLDDCDRRCGILDRRKKNDAPKS